ncbi:hypothetical protein BD626DRAFT_573946 [Schizophyllum amplum]|uniref:Uncharacterized protein n=1 Tax=Schizophyllum amplum TaxID=97359 RepID=A0A550C001_9AGAR|nr:hypothetical protein BD626DRAFT_573946 [Auriculariopsis ampla]
MSADGETFPDTQRGAALLTLSQEIEALVNSPWSAEEEAAVRRVEQSMNATNSVGPLEEDTRSSSQAIDDLYAQPWTEDELAVACRVEHEYALAQAQSEEALAPSNTQAWAPLLLGSVFRCRWIFFSFFRGMEPSSQAPAKAHGEPPEPLCVRPQDGSFAHANQRTFMGLPTAELRRVIISQPTSSSPAERSVADWFDDTAAHSGEETSSGDDEDDGMSGDSEASGDTRPFIVPSADIHLQDEHMHWVGLLTQNLPDGPQFLRRPVRSTRIGGPLALRMRAGVMSPSQGSQISTNEDDAYSIGSFVVDDEASSIVEQSSQ